MTRRRTLASLPSAGRDRPVTALLASARGGRNTRKALDLVLAGTPADVIDLARLDIGMYEYGRRSRHDDFLPLVDRLLDEPLWLLATPVYWYTMSGHLKVLFDRFGELLTVSKRRGKRLRGKDVAVVACGTDPRLPEGFEAPFRQTCDYLGMRYLGAFYVQFDGDRIVRRGAAREAQAFMSSLASSTGDDQAGQAVSPGPRAGLEKPGPRRQREFLDAVARSRRLHGRFVSPPATEAAYRKWLSRMGGKAYESRFVVDAASGALAGVINLSEIVRGAFQSGYLGYYAFAPHAGRGLMTGGMRQVIDRAFGELGLHRVEANIQSDNVASIALVRRLGFRREGYSPRYLKINGRWRDHERWALLREDWRPRQRPGSRGKE